MRKPTSLDSPKNFSYETSSKTVGELLKTSRSRTMLPRCCVKSLIFKPQPGDRYKANS